MSGQEVVDRLFGTPGDGIAARGIVADEGEILVLQLGVNSQLLVVGGHAEHVFGLVLPDQAAQLIGVEVGDDDHLDAQRQRQMYAAGKAVGNEGGHDVQQGLTLGKQRVAGGELHGNAVEVVIGQHHALGGAGGAAGMHHHTGVLRVIGLRGNALVLPGSKELLPVDDVGMVLVLVEILDLVTQRQRQRQGIGRGEHHHMLHMGALGSLMAALIHHIQADQQVGIHLFNVLTDTLHTVTGIHQVQSRADHVSGIERKDDLRGHHADHRGDIALFQARGPQGCCRLFDVDDKISVGELAAIVFQCGLAQPVLVLPADELKRRAGGHGLVNVLLIVEFQPGTCLGSIDRGVGCCHKLSFVL